MYKIKKQVHYSFLDFSTVELREHFCHREIELNKRLTDHVYIDVLPVYKWHGRYRLGGAEGTITDFAVRMFKLDPNKQMDVLLLQHKVTGQHLQQLAKKIALFHHQTTVVVKKKLLDVQQNFNDLESEREFLARQPGVTKRSKRIAHAIVTSDAFMASHKALLAERLKAGFFRDCHGDLHSRNIFLLPEPEPFDCIEFNEDFRQIDVLNEVAFLCMDLDAFGRQDLSALFIEYYNQYFPAINKRDDHDLFIYYKSYRANIRAKVSSLRAKTAATSQEKTTALTAADKYLSLMESYMKLL